jgi:hypothetical protein
VDLAVAGNVGDDRIERLHGSLAKRVGRKVLGRPEAWGE